MLLYGCKTLMFLEEQFREMEATETYFSAVEEVRWAGHFMNGGEEECV
jgi:hypothetical protein